MFFATGRGGTFEDLERCGATIAAIGAVLVLGTEAEEFATSKAMPLETMPALPNNFWGADDCPLCVAGIELQDVDGYDTAFDGD